MLEGQQALLPINRKLAVPQIRAPASCLRATTKRQYSLAIQIRSERMLAEPKPAPEPAAVFSHQPRFSLPQLTLRRARAFRKLAHNLWRQSRRQALPAFRQHIDKDALPCRHRVHGNLAHKRQTDRRAIRIASCRADIVRHGIRQFVDRKIDGLAEPDHQNGAGRHDFILDIFVELEDQPREALRNRKRRISLDGLRIGRLEIAATAEWPMITAPRLLPAIAPADAARSFR